MLHALVVGLVTLGFGLIPKIVRPKKINEWYGYRTEISKKNQDTWDEGNRYYTNQFILAGLILLAVGRIGYIFYPNKALLPPLIAFIPVLKFTVFTTEGHLKKIFDENGERIKDIKRVKQKRID